MDLMTVLKSQQLDELNGRYDGKVEEVVVEATRDSVTTVLSGDFHIDELKALVAFMESKP